MRSTIDQHTSDAVKSAIETRGLRAVSRETGVSPNTIKRATGGGRVTEKTLAALKKLPPTVRKREEFDTSASLSPSRVSTPSMSWTVATIRGAIDAQMRGRFSSPKRLAEAMRRDDAIFTARSSRIAPVSAVATRLIAHDSGLGRRIADDALDSVQVSRTTLRSLESTLVDHGIAIGYLIKEPNARGTRVNARLIEWPIEHVWWDDYHETLTTMTRDGQTVPIVHGDGSWIVVRRSKVTPWRDDAALLPAGFVWAAHAEGVAHWQAASKAHGLAKIVGAMPEGYDLITADGTVPPVVQKFLDMIDDLAAGDKQTVLKPFGSEVEFLANGSNAWQVFAENIISREKAAARIYLGTDAILGSVGGAPGVDISALFGVATTKLQGDFIAIKDALNSGVYVPWTAINHGESSKAPRWHFDLPDPDEERTREHAAANLGRFTKTLTDLKANGIAVTQDLVDRLASRFGVEPVPQLASVEAQTNTIQLAPTDVAKVVRVREARASQGLPPMGDERDDLFVSELEAYLAAKATAAQGTPAS